MAASSQTAALGRRRPASQRPAAPGAGSALGVASLCVLALLLTWVLAELVPAVRLRDATLLHDFVVLNSPSIEAVANFLIDLVGPVLVVIWSIALVAVASYRGRPRTAIAVAAVMALAPLSADRLKPLLAHRHVHIGSAHVGAASFPSGHTTAALALVLCALLVVPPRQRVVIAVLGGGFALAVGAALLVLHAHMPSDVLGGYLLAALWVALAVAALRACERRWPRRA